MQDIAGIFEPVQVLALLLGLALYVGFALSLAQLLGLVYPAAPSYNYRGHNYAMCLANLQLPIVMPMFLDSLCTYAMHTYRMFSLF